MGLLTCLLSLYIVCFTFHHQSLICSKTTHFLCHPAPTSLTLFLDSTHLLASSLLLLMASTLDSLWALRIHLPWIYIRYSIPCSFTVRLSEKLHEDFVAQLRFELFGPLLQLLLLPFKLQLVVEIAGQIQLDDSRQLLLSLVSMNNHPDFALRKNRCTYLGKYR